MSDKKRFPLLRIVKDTPDPLALYLRPGHNDHLNLSHQLAAGGITCSGIVFDPLHAEIHSELRDQVLKKNLDVILDPRTLQSATIGGYTEKIAVLPWGQKRPHTHNDFEDVNARRVISLLADYAIEFGYTQIMAPTHLLNSADDLWYRLDIQNTRYLRNYLDRKNKTGMQIIYQLAMPYKVFRDKAQRRELIKLMHGSPVSSLWLRIDGIGRNSTSVAAQNYIEACHEFHSLNIPVIADHVGGFIGLSLLAFGAVGGIAHGITLNESFHAGGWKRPRRPGSFGAPKTVYIPTIDAMLRVKDAENLFERVPKSRSIFACNDTHCCPRGVKDMLENPSRHFLLQRSKEISELSKIPETLRHQRFLDNHLRNATDKALIVANVKWDDKTFAQKMQGNRKRLDGLRTALGHYAEINPLHSFSLHPKTRLARSL